MTGGEESEPVSTTKSNDSGGGSGCGCITLPVFCIILWAILFGVTVDGKHYGISGCSCDRGVVVDK